MTAIVATADPVRLIQEALRGDIVPVLRRELPLLAELGLDAAYEVVMNDPGLAHAGFRLFRSKPELFSTVVVDAASRPVVDDAQGLKCGRTLAEAVALIVQAVGRRYFRRKLGGPNTVALAPARQAGLPATVLRRIGLAKPPPPPPIKRVTGAGDILFSALRPFLRYDWQTALIPHYAPLPPSVVAAMGPSLLKVREPCELRAVAAGTPLLLGGANGLFEDGGALIESEMLWRVANQMDLGRLFEGGDRARLRRAVAQISRTRREMVACLMPTLGDDIRLFVTFLFVAYAEMGEDEYRRVFSIVGATRWVVDKLAEKLKKAGTLPPPGLEDMRTFFARVVMEPARV
ncbi:MAG: hypothetical protein EPN20_18470 [Magnetospirillum sp.]|nr:MAG: hypothetical protein EPN20_18470 [Magnetospirillum sp.]